jgi:hypothetical protein
MTSSANRRAEEISPAARIAFKYESNDQNLWMSLGEAA